jgi:hypothetical protein
LLTPKGQDAPPNADASDLKPASGLTRRQALELLKLGVYALPILAYVFFPAGCGTTSPSGETDAAAPIDVPPSTDAGGGTISPQLGTYTGTFSQTAANGNVCTTFPATETVTCAFSSNGLQCTITQPITSSPVVCISGVPPSPTNLTVVYAGTGTIGSATIAVSATFVWGGNTTANLTLGYSIIGCIAAYSGTVRM